MEMKKDMSHMLKVENVHKTYGEMKDGGDAWGGSYPPTESCDGFDSRLCFQLKPTMR